MKKIDFDLLTRKALGLNTIEETPFSESTFYNFKRRLFNYYVETGINLIELVFDSLTLDQLKKLHIKADIQRSDSFQAMSNIRAYGRIQLLVEVLIRLHRILKNKDQVKFKDILSQFISQSSHKFMYTLKKSDYPHTLSSLAQVYHSLYKSLGSAYKDVAVFHIFERAYEEHFCVIDDTVTIRDEKELASSCMQSPDDLDATYHRKNGKRYKGFVVNVVETANPDNPVNLVADVAVEKNNVDDSTILNERLDVIAAKTPEINELHTDGAYGNERNDKKCQKHGIDHIQTNSKGNDARIKMEITKTESGDSSVTCPCQRSSTAQNIKSGYKVFFDSSVCDQCPNNEKCPTKKLKHFHAYYFEEGSYGIQKRKEALKKIPEERQKIRPNVEATVKEYTKGFNHKGKMKIRGIFKTWLFALTMSIAINFGRIYRYLLKNIGKKPRISSLLATILKHCKSIVKLIKDWNRNMELVIRKMNRIIIKNILLSSFEMSTF